MLLQITTIITCVALEKFKKECDILVQGSLRSMAVLLSRAEERRSREIRARSREKNKLLPPQSSPGFSALARLYYLARPTKTAMLRRLGTRFMSTEN